MANIAHRIIGKGRCDLRHFWRAPPKLCRGRGTMLAGRKKRDSARHGEEANARRNCRKAIFQAGTNLGVIAPVTVIITVITP